MIDTAIKRLSLMGLCNSSIVNLPAPDGDISMQDAYMINNQYAVNKKEDVVIELFNIVFSGSINLKLINGKLSGSINLDQR